MKTKQVIITLEQHRMEVEKETYYAIKQMKNAVVLDLGSHGPNNLKTIRAGDRLSEKQAQELSRFRNIEVTVKA